MYGVFDPYSEHELEKQLVGLNVEEAFPIFEGIGLQKDSGWLSRYLVPYTQTCNVWMFLKPKL